MALWRATVTHYTLARHLRAWAAEIEAVTAEEADEMARRQCRYERGLTVEIIGVDIDPIEY